MTKDRSILREKPFHFHARAHLTDKTEVATPATPSVLETKVAGEFPLYYAIAQQTGLLEDLISTWGEDRANAILSLPFHWLNTSFNAAYLYR